MTIVTIPCAKKYIFSSKQPKWFIINFLTKMQELVCNGNAHTWCSFNQWTNLSQECNPLSSIPAIHKLHVSATQCAYKCCLAKDENLYTYRANSWHLDPLGNVNKYTTLFLSIYLPFKLSFFFCFRLWKKEKLVLIRLLIFTIKSTGAK